jgi:hypothetical protein
MTVQRLECRRGETWQGLWLAPLLTIVAQGFLLIALADETVGWLARAAVLAASLAANLAALWSVLRAHAREVQYSEAIDAELAATADGDYADVRAAALARPSRRRPTPAAAAVADVDPTHVGQTPVTGGEEPATVGPDGEEETAIIDPDPTPPPAPAEEPRRPREGWVVRWDRHLTWWAAGETHAKSYMAWSATLLVFMLADIAVYVGTV